MKLKVITLNLWIGGILFDAILEFLNKENPDLLILQEVNNGEDLKFEKNYRSLQILRENVDLKNYVFSPSFKDITNSYSVERGNAIYSRYPIKLVNSIFYEASYKVYNDIENQPEEFPVLPRNLQHAEVIVDNSIINVFNTQGIWGLDGGDSERRLLMSEIIVNQIKEKQNVILAGDFNVKPNTQTIYNIEKHLKNIFKDELVSTFNMKRKTNPGYATAVVDMIFVSPHIKVVDHYCPQVDISDHLPLVCTLDI
ncbi:MAG TPA: endonuclease/exonuclease/phosphatase family protein [Candidatus Nitrosocosmicus sp.]|nr:endonuclease/exonuclease/phosphatase family protein [Candidatus Nitrosocosmicus sp.]